MARTYTAILEYELPREVDGVVVVGPPGVDRFLLECTRSPAPGPLTAEAFLQRDAYTPLPSLVRAARDLFAHQPLPRIKRARAATEPHAPGCSSHLLTCLRVVDLPQENWMVPQ